MKKILFVLMAAAMLVSCNNLDENINISRRIPFRVKHISTLDISIVYADSALKVNDTVWINYYHKYVVLLERVK